MPIVILDLTDEELEDFKGEIQVAAWPENPAILNKILEAIEEAKANEV